MKWPLLLLGGALTLLFMIDQTVQRTRLDAFAERLDRTPIAAAQDLAASAEQGCPRSEKNGEAFRLAQALFAVEVLATSHSERIVEGAITRLFRLVGLAGPDFSVGEGQIRISMMQKGLRDLPAEERPDWSEGRLDVLDLFERCRALAIASLLIRHHVQARPDADGLMPRSEVERVARFWNGQKKAKSKDAVLAGLRYREAVYRTFMILRFRSRRRVRRL